MKVNMSQQQTTGLMQFGDAKPGVYLDHDDCIAVADDLRQALRYLDGKLEAKIGLLLQLLEGVK
jgi:regulator of sigma D